MPGTIRETRRTYKRKRCGWVNPDGYRCRFTPVKDTDRCLLHTETTDDDARDT